MRGIAPLPHGFVRDGPYPPRSGNLVRSLIDGRQTFTRICEAIESAEHSVFATIAFIHPDFVMPGSAGSLFDVLDRAAARGLEVRVIFWRSGPEAGIDETEHFPGVPHQREILRERGSTFAIRWDCAGEAVCHHQKSWLVDAGHPGEVAFVGGINLNPRSLVSPGHREDMESHHDVYVEIAGPSATDVHENFVERWNLASERQSADGTWGALGEIDLEQPTNTSEPRGDSIVQIQRTVHARGEHTIFTQYVQAIDAAERTIYIENQALEDSRILDRLKAALARGVVVVALVPTVVDSAARAVRSPSADRAIARALAALAGHDDFTIAGIVVPRPDGAWRSVYVHAKVIVVDDALASIGSCNIRARSFFTHTELNATICDPSVVRALRNTLFDEHLDIDTRSLDDVAALRLFSKIARGNAAASAAMQGNALAFDPRHPPSDGGCA